jgi:hypothetical protein
MRSRFEIYCELIHWGLLNIRFYSTDPERCHAEADHLHNLPTLLQDFENERLHREYWDIARPCFISNSRPDWLHRYNELWAELPEATRRETGAELSP